MNYEHNYVYIFNEENHKINEHGCSLRELRTVKSRLRDEEKSYINTSKLTKYPRQKIEETDKRTSELSTDTSYEDGESFVILDNCLSTYCMLVDKVMCPEGDLKLQCEGQLAVLRPKNLVSDCLSS